MAERGYEIDLFRPCDAAGVAQLFMEVYGNGYPVKIVYDTEEFAKAVARQDYIPAVGRTPVEEIVGFSSFYGSAPNQKPYEIGGSAWSQPSIGERLSLIF